MSSRLNATVTVMDCSGKLMQLRAPGDASYRAIVRFSYPQLARLYCTASLALGGQATYSYSETLNDFKGSGLIDIDIDMEHVYE